ncbi:MULTISPECIES: ParB/RepB/Spo0J family partition protein [Hyphomicrobiales]|uniref:ParB/RepB/Spo0J family partition protein n=1 Tax=Hyphomicrobiales TaxID=356 RepID=UPI0012FE269E|nr:MULTISPECIES: ParB/RepB/Spo0J family partition protein [Brucella]
MTDNNNITVPLNKLDHDPRNVRQTYEAAEIAEMAASIKARNFRLIHNLVIRPGEKKGRYFVTAGGLRLAGLNLLAEQGEIGKTHGVDCGLWDGEDATEISLAENFVRKGMHPADEFMAFKTLADEGKSPAEIAVRFGTTELNVKRRMALARVSPVLFDLFRNGEMSYDELAAFTITDDHERQEQVWNSLASYNRYAHTIKRMLASEEIPASDKRIRFIGGLDAIEAAGGTVRRDLFDGESGGYATDSGLVERLVLEKLETEAEGVKAEGWKWVEVHSAQPDDIYSMSRVYPEPVDISAEDQERLDQLAEEYDSLAELIEAGDADEDAEPKLEAIEKEMDSLKDRQEAYKAEDLARAGAIVCLDYYGRATVHRGLVNDEDEQQEQEEGQHSGENEGSRESEAAPIKLTHSAALVEDLTAQKTAALRVELADNPDIALAAVVHALLLSAVYRYASEHTALEIKLTYQPLEGSMKQPENSKAGIAFQELKERYGDHIPGNPADLWEWCLDQPRDQLLVLLAFAASHSLNAVEAKFHGRDKALAHANEIGRALNVDMRNWFEPTGDAYLSHLNKKSIEAVVAEVKGEEAATAIRAAGKKAEAVAIAERMVANTGWLPEPVRIPMTEIEAEQQFPEAAE